MTTPKVGPVGRQMVQACAPAGLSVRGPFLHSGKLQRPPANPVSSAGQACRDSPLSGCGGGLGARIPCPLEVLHGCAHDWGFALDSRLLPCCSSKLPVLSEFILTQGSASFTLQ